MSEKVIIEGPGSAGEHRVAEEHRVEGRDKVTGTARYAFEHPVADAVYAYPLQSPIANGQIGSFDAATALAMPGVIAVLWGGNTPPFGGKAFELSLFNRNEVTYRGQLIGAVIADTLENARAAAAAVRVDYTRAEHDVVLRADHPGLYRPEKINPALPTDTGYGDVAAGLAAPVRAGTGARVDVTYTTPVQHNNPMEPHAAIASWDSADAVTIYDSTQGPSADRDTIATVLGLDPVRVRVISPHVGGGFGSKGTTRPHAILAAIAARAVGRPVKVALTRQQMFTLTGHRTPTIQHLEIGADADGRLTALAHDVIEHTATRTEFAEQTAALHPRHVRDAGDAHHPPAGAAERARPVVDARTGGGPGDVRARVGDGRAGGGARHGPGRAARRQRAGHRTRERGAGERAAVQLAEPRRLPARGRGPLRLGRA